MAEVGERTDDAVHSPGPSSLAPSEPSDFPERSAAKPLSDLGKRDSFRIGKA